MNDTKVVKMGLFDLGFGASMIYPPTSRSFRYSIWVRSIWVLVVVSVGGGGGGNDGNGGDRR